MPTSSAILASLRLSGQLPDQRSGTSVTARPDEQLAPNRPILSLFALCIDIRSWRDGAGASTGPPGSPFVSGHQASPWPPRFEGMLAPRRGARTNRLPAKTTTVRIGATNKKKPEGGWHAAGRSTADFRDGCELGRAGRRSGPRGWLPQPP